MIYVLNMMAQNIALLSPCAQTTDTLGCIKKIIIFLYQFSTVTEMTRLKSIIAEDNMDNDLFSVYQVEAEAELRGWKGFRGWAQIQSHAETTDHSRKLARAIVCR